MILDVDVFGNHRVIEWCVEIRQAVENEVRARFPELIDRWPHVGGGLRCDAYELPPNKVALVLHHVDEPVVTAVPSKALALPDSVRVATDDDVEQVQLRLTYALDLPPTSILIVLLFTCAPERTDRTAVAHHQG